MPGRTYVAGTGYRYGFNGKENDNEVKGTGNQQDYGMRIYDPRIGKFLSVDPLQKKYPFYSPYQFAGNGPISNKDADGGEPKSYTWDWKYVPLFDLKTNKLIDENLGMAKTIDDPVLGQVDVEMVYDSWTNQSWFIHKDDRGNHYYLKNDNGRSDVLTLKGGTIKISGGHLEPFKTYNQVASEQSDALMKGVLTGMAGAVALPFMISAAPAVGSAAWAAWSNPYVQFAIGGDIAGAYAYEYAVGEERAIVQAASSSTYPANTKPSIVETTVPDEVVPPAKLNLNSNSAEGHFVLYEVEEGGIKLKVGKANANDIMADGTIRRIHTSERKAQQAGYPNAKSKVVEDLGTTTTGKAKEAEASRVKNERTNGHSLPLNKEKDKRYHND